MPHVTGVTGTSTREKTHKTDHWAGHEVIEILSDSEDERPIPKTENVSIDSIMTTSSGENLKTENLKDTTLDSKAQPPLVVTTAQNFKILHLWSY